MRKGARHDHGHVRGVEALLHFGVPASTERRQLTTKTDRVTVLQQRLLEAEVYHLDVVVAEVLHKPGDRLCEPFPMAE